MRCFICYCFLVIFLAAQALAKDAIVWPRLVRIYFAGQEGKNSAAALSKTFNVDNNWKGEASVPSFEKVIDFRIRRVDFGHTGDGTYYEEWALPFGREDSFVHKLSALPQVKRIERLSLLERGSSTLPKTDWAFQRHAQTFLIPRAADENLDRLLKRCDKVLTERYHKYTVVSESEPGEASAIFSVYHLQNEVLPKFWQWLVINLDFVSEPSDWRISVTLDLNVTWGSGDNVPTFSEYKHLSDEYAPDLAVYQTRFVKYLQQTLEAP